MSETPHPPKVHHTSDTDDAVQKLKKHINTVLMAAIVVLVVFTVYNLRNNRTRQARDLAAMDYANASAPEQLQEILLQYPDNPLSALALIRLASTYFQDQAYEQALEQYKRFTDTYPDHDFAPCAELGRLMCLEALGMVDQALAGHQAVPADALLYPQHQLGAARCLEQLNRLPEARDVYEALTKSREDTLWAQQAEEYRKMVDRLIRSQS